jgi:two-component system phosphate regulon response regulator PhoB
LTAQRDGTANLNTQVSSDIGLSSNRHGKAQFWLRIDECGCASQNMHRILLTKSDAAMIAAIRRAFPGVEVSQIDPASPGESVGAKTWCFVDWLLSDMAGLELCRQLRTYPATAGSHITMVLEDDDPASRRRAIGAGADDYMPGPATAQGLIDRLKRYTADQTIDQDASSARAAGGLTLDPAAHQVRWRGKLVTLRPREVALLEAFLDNPDRLLTRAKLITMAGKNGEIDDERTVDVWVGRLRRSLEAQGVPRIVRTVRSHGYVLDTPDLGS